MPQRAHCFYTISMVAAMDRQIPYPTPRKVKQSKSRDADCWMQHLLHWRVLNCNYDSSSATKIKKCTKRVVELHVRLLWRGGRGKPQAESI